MTFYPIDKTINLHNSYRKVVKLNGLSIMLIQHDDKLSILEAFCPHAGYPMDNAKIIGTNLRCSMHAYLFDISSGECTYAIDGPCRGLKTYAVAYRRNEVGVML